MLEQRWTKEQLLDQDPADVAALAWSLSARRAMEGFADLDEPSKVRVDLFLFPLDTGE